MTLRKSLLLTTIFLAALFMGQPLRKATISDQTFALAEGEEAQKLPYVEAHGRLPMSIEANSGQTAGLAPADMLVLKHASQSQVKTGGQLVYRIAVVDLGPADASGVVVNDPLPSETSLVSASFTKTACTKANGRISCTATAGGVPCASSGGTVTCSIGDLPKFSLSSPSGAAVKLVVEVSAPPGSFVTNEASVTASNPDPNSANNFSAIATPVR